MTRLIRELDHTVCEELVNGAEDFDIYYENWLENPKNIALRDGEGNIGFAEIDNLYPFIYFVHIVSNSKKGRDAQTFAKDMMREMFETYEAEHLIGRIPPHNKKSRVFALSIGFNRLPFSHTDQANLYSISRKDFFSK